MAISLRRTDTPMLSEALNPLPLPLVCRALGPEARLRPMVARPGLISPSASCSLLLVLVLKCSCSSTSLSTGETGFLRHRWDLVESVPVPPGASVALKCPLSALKPRI